MRLKKSRLNARMPKSRERLLPLHCSFTAWNIPLFPSFNGINLVVKMDKTLTGCHVSSAIFKNALCLFLLRNSLAFLRNDQPHEASNYSWLKENIFVIKTRLEGSLCSNIVIAYIFMMIFYYFRDLRPFKSCHWSRHQYDDDEVLRQALLSVFFVETKDLWYEYLGQDHGLLQIYSINYSMSVAQIDYTFDWRKEQNISSK